MIFARCSVPLLCALLLACTGLTVAPVQAEPSTKPAISLGVYTKGEFQQAETDLFLAHISQVLDFQFVEREGLENLYREWERRAETQGQANLAGLRGVDYFVWLSSTGLSHSPSVLNVINAGTSESILQISFAIALSDHKQLSALVVDELRKVLSNRAPGNKHAGLTLAFTTPRFSDADMGVKRLGVTYLQSLIGEVHDDTVTVLNREDTARFLREKVLQEKHFAVIPGEMLPLYGASYIVKTEFVSETDGSKAIVSLIDTRSGQRIGSKEVVLKPGLETKLMARWIKRVVAEHHRAVVESS